MKKSIVAKNLDKCYFCGMPRTDIHHIYPGSAKRMISDREGFILPLCHRHHTAGNNSVHGNSKLMLMTKKICQYKYESMGHTREEFIKLIGRNYLGDDEE